MSRRDPEHVERGASDEQFLERWSRLKSQSQESDQASAGEDQATPPASPEDARPPLPDLERLDQDSDYSAFLAPGVDAALRRTALRKLFRSPKFNVCDGLDDYCDDFTQFAPLGDVVTSDMRHQLERAARRLAQEIDAPRASEPPAAVAALDDPPPDESPTVSTEGNPAHDDDRPA